MISLFHIVVAAGLAMQPGGAPASSMPDAPPARVKAFQDRCAKLAAGQAEKPYLTIAGRDGWLTFGPDLRYLSLSRFWGADAAKVSKAAKPEFADPIPALVKLHNDLKQSGVELLVAPVPPKVLVYPEMFDADQKPGERLDAGFQGFAKALGAEGVTVVDLLPQLAAARADDAKLGPVYCRTDLHYSPRGAAIVARALSQTLAARPWAGQLEPTSYATEDSDLQITGDLVRIMGDDGKAIPKEKLPFRRVGVRRGEKLEPIEPSPRSPVLLLGDSHVLVYHDGGDLHATQGGLPDLMAKELGFAMDVCAIRGSASTAVRIDLFRSIRENPARLKSKKAVIYCFTARELTESAAGWRPLPLTAGGR